MAGKIHVDLAAANSQLEYVNQNDWVLLLDKAKNLNFRKGETLIHQGKQPEMVFGLEFSIPMFFIQGAEDFTTPTALARNYLDIKAPRKEFVAIKDGGHFAGFIHSDQFLQELVRRVRPLAVGR